MGAVRKPVVLSMGVSSKSPDELGKLELWELGRRKLGYGDWHPEHPEPYQKWSGMESHKLFMVMRKRNVKPADFVLAVDYAQRHHHRIENAIWVLRLVGEAKAEQRELQADQAKTDLGKAVEQALAYERGLSDEHTHDWIGKLTRARGPYREEVLVAWDKTRKP